MLSSDLNSPELGVNVDNGLATNNNEEITASNVNNSNFEELRVIVHSTLEKQGILASVQSQLRGHVFTALLETHSNNNGFISKLDSNDKHISYSIALIMDFLRFYSLNYSASLIKTESQTNSKLSANEIATRLQLGACKPVRDKPLLYKLVEKHFICDVLNAANQEMQNGNENEKVFKERESNQSTQSNQSSDNQKSTIFFKQKSLLSDDNTHSPHAHSDEEESMPSSPKPNYNAKNVSAMELVLTEKNLMNTNTEKASEMDSISLSPGMSSAVDDLLNELDETMKEKSNFKKTSKLDSISSMMEQLKRQTSELESNQINNASAQLSSDDDYEDDFDKVSNANTNYTNFDDDQSNIDIDIDDEQTNNNNQVLNEIGSDIIDELDEESNDVDVDDDQSNDEIYSAEE